jgi:NAD+ kinase
MQCIGILYHPKHKKALAFSRKLEKILRSEGISTWLCSAWEPEKASANIAGSDMIFSIGGDGTILRTARAVIPNIVPILGINLGRLGFMAELEADDVEAKLPGILNDKGWIEERVTLSANLLSQNKTCYALNDVFIGRRSSARLVTVDCNVNGKYFTTYRADGVLVATASGSTGYSLAASGPILYPEARDIILKPVCPHFTLDKSIILPSETVIELTVTTSHEAMASIDGQVETQIYSGDKTLIKVSQYTVRFLRVQPKNYFLKSLESKLKRAVL